MHHKTKAFYSLFTSRFIGFGKFQNNFIFLEKLFSFIVFFLFHCLLSCHFHKIFIYDYHARLFDIPNVIYSNAFCHFAFFLDPMNLALIGIWLLIWFVYSIYFLFLFIHWIPFHFCHAWWIELCAQVMIRHLYLLFSSIALNCMLWKMWNQKRCECYLCPAEREQCVVHSANVTKHSN